jgi:hypothetical protein
MLPGNTKESRIMRSNRHLGAATLLGFLGAGTAGGCDLVAGIGTYCTEGVDPGCGTGGTGGSGGVTTTTSMAGAGGTPTTSSMGGGGTGGAGECTPGVTQECYTGPEETKNIGACKAGTQTCQSGGTWGSCEGEVLPKTEDCKVAGDEDCNFGVGCSEAVWGKVFGDVSFQWVREVAFDADGNLYAVGEFSGTLDFGGDPLISGGSDDVFVVKLDPSGNHVWSRRFGDAASQGAVGVAVDSGGGVVVAGRLNGSMDVGGEVLTNEAEEDIFVFKLDSEGTRVWARRFGDPDAETSQTATDVAVDKDGNVVLVGYLSGQTLDFDGEVLAAMGGGPFVTKLSPDGATVWATTFGDAQNQGARQVAVDSAGNIAVVGYFSGVINFLGVAVLTATGMDAFVARFDSGGNCAWASKIDSVDSMNGPYPTGVVVDSAGNVIVGGRIASSTDAGGGTVAPSMSDALVVKYSSGGAFQWQKLFGGPDIDTGPNVAGGADDRLALTFYSSGTVDLGTGELPPNALSDVVLAALDTDGTVRWAKRYGLAGSQQSYGVAVGPKGEIGLGILASGDIDFGSGALTTKGDDVALAVIAPE